MEYTDEPMAREIAANVGRRAAFINEWGGCLSIVYVIAVGILQAIYTPWILLIGLVVGVLLMVVAGSSGRGKENSRRIKEIELKYPSMVAQLTRQQCSESDSPKRASNEF